MKSTFKIVTESLRNCGFTVLELSTGKCGKIAFLPDFGRIIGLWTSPDDNSLLWFNPEFLESALQDPLSDTPIWANPGGDRLWLSPERDFFIEDYNDPWGTYSVPDCIDPGDYTFVVDGDNIILNNSGYIKGHGSNSFTTFNVTRQFRSLCEAELIELGQDPLVESSGYEEYVTLEIPADIPTPISYWNLSQVPSGGIVKMGVMNNTPETVVYLGETAGCIGDSSQCLQPVHFEGNNQYKIGLPAADSSGFLAYLRQDNISSTLLIRTFDIDLNGVYVDVPPDGRPGKTCPVQLYYGGDTYDFGELEYHSPALTKSSETHICNGVSRLYAFRGPEYSLMQILSNFQSLSLGINQ